MAVALVMAMALTLFGCGGGSGSSGSTTTTNLNTFVTDDLTLLYDQVWVDFYGIDLVKSDGTTVNLYKNAAGDHIDVRALNDGTNAIYRFMGSTPIPAGNYKGFTMVLGKTVTLYPKASTSPITATFPDELDTGTNQSLIKVDFAAPKTFTDGEGFPIDFNLKAWSIKAGNKIVWSIVKGDGTGLDDPNRHEQHGIEGEISELAGTAPTQTFTLLPKKADDDDRKVPVTTNDKTVVIAATNSDSPTLATGQKVEVVGSFDTTTKTFVAVLIRIRPATVVTEQGAHGLVTDAAADGTFKLGVREAFGFVPAARQITVTTTGDTMFYDGSGQAITLDSFVSSVKAATEPKAKIVGTYDKPSNTFAATRVMLDKTEAPLNVLVTGKVTEIHPTTDFSISLTGWEGFGGAANLGAKIVLKETTTYQDIDEKAMTKEAFFAALAAGKVVSARGQLAAGGVVNADVVRIRQNSSTDNSDNAEAFGVPESVSIGDGFFNLKLIKWRGFDSTFGSVVKVTFADGAKFFDKGNNSVGKADWLTLVNGDIKRSVSVEGKFTGGVFIAVRARQND